MSSLPIARVRTDGGTQTRACIRPEVVEEYAEMNGELPPITVFYDGHDYWLADGFHRIEARKKQGKHEIECDIQSGTLRAATVYSFSANARHGLRRSNEDKRYSVIKALSDVEWVAMSDRFIGEMCAVTHQFVGKIRVQLATSASSNNEKVRNGENGKTDDSPQGSGSNDDVEKRTGKDGKKRGRKKPTLCDRCLRLGSPVVDCPQCAEVRKKAASKKQKKKAPKQPEERPEIKDATGSVVPDHLRDQFADQSLPKLIDELENAADVMDPEHQLMRAIKLIDHYGFILVDKFKEHVYEAKHQQQLAIAALQAGIPHAVCPRCNGVDSKGNGKVCQGCRGYGFVPEHRYDELKTGRL